jgi:hypothetical protein
MGFDRKVASFDRKVAGFDRKVVTVFICSPYFEPFPLCPKGFYTQHPPKASELVRQHPHLDAWVEN